MLHTINTKILLSGAVILAASAVIVGATFAFFSDTETSTANTLAAGDIDLQIDNESYVTNNLGVLVASPLTSWVQKDLVLEKFFDFTDIKPGDIGEDTISIHVGSNDAWVCAAARITDNSDVDCTEPELADDPSCTTPGLTQGELASQVNFSFWKDDGDNVLEVGETPFLTGPISGLGQAGQISLVDSAGGPFGPSPIPGGEDRFIGKAWCFGNLAAGTVGQDGLGKLGSPSNPSTANGPLVRGTGFTCDGALVNNAAQTDRVMADLQFFAVQSRNNATFTCAGNFTPTWPQD